MRRHTWGARGAIGLALVTLAGACGGEAPPAEAAAPLPAGTVLLSPARLRTAALALDTVRLQEVSLPLRVPATLETPEAATAHVGSIVEGRVDEVLVLPGDRVARGTPLLLIHSHELATAHRDWTAAQAAAAAAQAAYDRSVRLLADEAVPREEVERREAALAAARAELERAREIVDHLSPSPQGDVTVRAPRSGVVFTVHVRAGEAVVPGTSLVDLGEDRELWATGHVPENAAFTAARGTAVTLTLDAFPAETLRARIVRTGGIVDSLRRALEVRVALLDRPAAARPGMFATLVLPAGARERRAVLPEEAVQRMAEADVVFVQETPGRFRARPVRAAAIGGGRVAVEGLEPGVLVVTRGAYVVRAALEGAPADEE